MDDLTAIDRWYAARTAAVQRRAYWEPKLTLLASLARAYFENSAHLPKDPVTEQPVFTVSAGPRDGFYGDVVVVTALTGPRLRMGVPSDSTNLTLTVENATFGAKTIADNNGIVSELRENHFDPTASEFVFPTAPNHVMPRKVGDIFGRFAAKSLTVGAAG